MPQDPPRGSFGPSPRWIAPSRKKKSLINKGLLLIINKLNTNRYNNMLKI